jgi:hypothetical protein
MAMGSGWEGREGMKNATFWLLIEFWALSAIHATKKLRLGLPC